MLRMVTTLGRSGLQDWLIQRISAVILGLYTLTIMGFWLSSSGSDYTAWQDLFSHILMRFATLLALLALIAHAWIGIWTITTDYLKKTLLRLPVQLLVYVILLFYLIWGLQILWG